MKWTTQIWMKEPQTHLWLLWKANLMERVQSWTTLLHLLILRTKALFLSTDKETSQSPSWRVSTRKTKWARNTAKGSTTLTRTHTVWHQDTRMLRSPKTQVRPAPWCTNSKSKHPRQRSLSSNRLRIESLTTQSHRATMISSTLQAQKAHHQSARFSKLLTHQLYKTALKCLRMLKKLRGIWTQSIWSILHTSMEASTASTQSQTSPLRTSTWLYLSRTHASQSSPTWTKTGQAKLTSKCTSSPKWSSLTSTHRMKAPKVPSKICRSSSKSH